MRVIRYKGQFGTAIQTAGPGVAREPAPVALAGALDRPIGKGGGLRDPLPGTRGKRPLRDGYVTAALTRESAAWVKREGAKRGLATGAFMGMVLERVSKMDEDALDDFLCDLQ